MSGPLVRVENPSKNFDRLPVLKDVTFPLAEREVTEPVGRQGARKPTLLVYIFLGRFFLRGLMAGALKG